MKAGKSVQVPVEWLVDTGADIGVVDKAIGDRFDLTSTGASASPTTGGGGIIVKAGLDAEFAAEDTSGASHTIRASLPVGVKSVTTGSNIVGMDQLASFSVTVDWDPAGGTGTLRTPLPPPSAAAPPASTASGSLRRPGPPPAIVDHGTWLDIGGIRVEKNLWRKP
jgi:hypothetical protein